MMCLHLCSCATPHSANQDAEVSASPVLITDPNLPAQYSVTHIHPVPKDIFTEGHNYPQLSDFGIVDWTTEAHRPNSTKLSSWRTKAKPKASKRDSQTSMSVGAPPSPGKSVQVLSGPDKQIFEKITHLPAIAVDGKFTFGSWAEEQGTGFGLDDGLEIDVIPLHIFVDLGLVLSDGALSFVDEVIGGDGANTTGVGCDDDEDNGGNESDGSIGTTKQESERQRLEKLVLEELELELDYRDDGPRRKVTKPKTSVSHGQRKGKVCTGSFIHLFLSRKFIKHSAVSTIKIQKRAKHSSQSTHDKI